MKYQKKIEDYLSYLGFKDIASLMEVASYSFDGTHRFSADFTRSSQPHIVRRMVAALGKPDSIVKNSYARFVVDDRFVMLYQLNDPDMLRISLISDSKEW